MCLLSSLKSDIVCTVLSFLGSLNVDDAHQKDGCHFNTPIAQSHEISFMRIALCFYGIGYGLPWYGFIPSFISKDTGSRFQSRRVPLNSNSNLSSIKSSSLFQMHLGESLTGKAGCWCVKTGVKMTDMCLSGWHVANMLADMSATRHKKLSSRVPLVLGRHVTCWHVRLVLLWCWQTCVRCANMYLTCCRHVAPQSIKLSN